MIAKTAPSLDIAGLETELKKRLAYPATPWGRKQSNAWDKATNFIYTIKTWAGLQRRVEGMSPELRNYAVNRWFNFWSAMGIEAVFCSLPGVEPAVNPKNRLVDFSLRGIRFDHKTTVYPAGYPGTFLRAIEHPEELAEWLYHNQSTGQRFHTANRLFIVLHKSGGDHWRLRAELSVIREAVERYVAGFAVENLIEFRLDNDFTLTDIIWISR